MAQTFILLDACRALTRKRRKAVKEMKEVGVVTRRQTILLNRGINTENISAKVGGTGEEIVFDLKYERVDTLIAALFSKCLEVPFKWLVF